MKTQNKSSIFITGDCHRNFDKIYEFCNEVETTRNDIMIIAGDAGINWYCDPVLKYDEHLKKSLSKLPITLVIVLTALFICSVFPKVVQI